MSSDEYKLRKISNLSSIAERKRQLILQRFMKSGLTRFQAQTTLQQSEVKAAGAFCGLAGGASLLFLTRPLWKMLHTTVPLARKSFVYYPLKAAMFTLGFSMPYKFRSGYIQGRGKNVSFEKVANDPNLLSGFRLYEEQNSASHSGNSEHSPGYGKIGSLEENSSPKNYMNQTETERQIKNYLIDHHPITSDGMEELFLEKAQYDPEIAKRLPNLSIKKIGLDRDPLYYNFGKIHGLENAALLSKEELSALIGNPIALQHAIFRRTKEYREKLKREPLHNSFEDKLNTFRKQLDEHKKNLINGPGHYVSEQKRLLSLPFYLARNQEDPPLPPSNSWEARIFKELFGHDVHEGEDDPWDLEKKITQYDYEDHLTQYQIEALGGVQNIANNEKIRDEIRKMNIMTMTKLERMDFNRKLFRKQVMPVLMYLNEEEAMDYVGYLHARASNDPQLERIRQLCDRTHEERLSKLSEEARFETKAYQQLQHEKLSFINKERIRIDESRIEKALTNQEQFFQNIDQHLGTYHQYKQLKNSFKAQILLNFSKSTGKMGLLAKELGISDEQDLAKHAPPSDAQLYHYDQNLKTSSDPDPLQFASVYCTSFPPIDLTEYDEFNTSDNQFNQDYHDHPFEIDRKLLDAFIYEEQQQDDDMPRQLGMDYIQYKKKLQEKYSGELTNQEKRNLGILQLGSADIPLKLTRSTVAEAEQNTDVADGEDFTPQISMMKPGLTVRDYLLPKIIRENKYNKNVIYGLNKKVPKELLYNLKDGDDEEEEQPEQSEEPAQENDEQEEEDDGRPNYTRILSNIDRDFYQEQCVKQAENFLEIDELDKENDLRAGIHFRDENSHAHDYENRFFRHHEKIQDRFDENEIEAFMKVMNIRTAVHNWRDMSIHHHRLGINYFEDIAQIWDPLYLATSDREQQIILEKQIRNWRRGPLIRFRAGEKDKRVHYESPTH